MKKIKSIKQLRAQKEHINRRLDYLEQSMKLQWSELKYGLKPSSIIKDAIAGFLKSKTDPDFGKGNILKSAFTYGASLLAGKLAEKARRKFRPDVKK